MSDNALVAQPESRAVTYTPLAESEPITLTVGLVMNQMAVKTRSGKVPAVSDVIMFMMLCKSRGLNPFVGDAYLVGYDSNDGPKFQLITAIQSLRKRAEANPKFNGAQRGVIVQAGDQVTEREGAMVFAGETLVGGWGRVLRKDCSTAFYETVKLATYNTKQSRWAKDPEGMIAKVGEAAALRRAFPSDVGALYIAEEFDNAHTPKPPAVTNGTAPKRPTLDDLAKEPSGISTPVETKADPAPEPTADNPRQEPPTTADNPRQPPPAQEEETLRRLEEEAENRPKSPAAPVGLPEPAGQAEPAPTPTKPPVAATGLADALEGPALKALIDKYVKSITRTITPKGLDDLEQKITGDYQLPNNDAEDLLNLLANRRAELDNVAK